MLKGKCDRLPQAVLELIPALQKSLEATIMTAQSCAIFFGYLTLNFYWLVCWLGIWDLFCG